MIVEYPMSLDEATVVVEFEYQPGYEPTKDDPGTPEEMWVTRVRIGKDWVDSEYFAEFQLTRWTEQGLEKIEDSRVEALAERLIPHDEG